MDFIDDVRTRSRGFAHRREHLETEEGTKTALVMPFIQMLGYDPFDPKEVVPEFTTAYEKKDAKVDYAIFQDGHPVILIEAKKYGAPLQVEQESQLFSYINASDARFGILTDGIRYEFYADLDEQNKMDRTPFLIFDMLNFTEAQVVHLERFHKEQFSSTETIEAAREIKDTDQVKGILAEEINAPSDDFVRFVLNRIGLSKGKQLVKRFAPLVQSAFAQYVGERIDAQLKSAPERGNEMAGQADAEAGAKGPSATRRTPEGLPLAVFLNTKNGVEAEGRPSGKSFFVLSDSHIAKRTASSLSPAVRQRRESMLENGLLIDNGPAVYRLTEDCEFSSASGAAAFVLGWPASGPRQWKDSEGRTLKDLLG